MMQGVALRTQLLSGGVMPPVAAPVLASISTLSATSFVSAPEAVDAVLAVMQELLGMGTVFLSEANRDGEHLTIVAVRDGAGERRLGLSVGLEVPFEQTLCRRVIESAEPHSISDLRQDPHLADVPMVRELHVTSYVSVPVLKADGSPFGTLCGLDRALTPVSPDQISWLRILAGFVGHQLERQRFEAQLAHQALHDGLTGLANRAQFLERLTSPRRPAGLDDGSVVLLYLDVDGFKQINDTLGHVAGDALLRAVADRLRKSVRERDFVARLGSDEFVVLGDGAERAEDAEVIASRILSVFEEPFEVAGGTVAVRWSIGISLSDYLPDPEDLTGLLREADCALSQAKRRGKGCYVVYDPAMNLVAPVRADAAA
jgi:diguanylate cyclase (GGDEF)-like protein